MKVELVFPPFWGDPGVPHVAVPALVSYLNLNGHNARQWDLNLDALYYFFDDRTLAWAADTVRARLRDRADSAFDADCARLIAASMRANHVRAQIPGALSVFDDVDAFSDMEALAWAKDILNMALDLVGAAHHPARLELFRYFGFEGRFSYESSAHLLAALDHPDENPFVRFYEKERVVERITDRGAKLYGFSISNQVQLLPTLALARMIRQADPEARIVLGGNIITRIREFIVDAPALFDLVDYWVVYEGEDPLLHLVNALETGGDLAKVPNLVFRAEDGRIVSTNHRTGKMVNKVGPPDFDGLKLDQYFMPGVILPYTSAVGGCYWRRCTFCEITGGYSDVFQSRQFDKIVADLDHLCKRYGTNYIYLTDEAQSPERLVRMSDGILKAGLDIRWMAMAKVDSKFKPASFTRIFEAGCRVLMFGVESTSQKVLKQMLKGTSPKAYRMVLGDSHDAGIWTHGFFMFDFPTESKEQGLETVQFIDKERTSLDSIGSSRFELGLLTPVFMEPGKYGVEVHPNPEHEDLKLFHEYTATLGKSERESEEVQAALNTIKRDFYQRKGFPERFGAAIGNSVNFITLLLGRHADTPDGPQRIGPILKRLAGTRLPGLMAPEPPSAEEGTVALDDALHYELHRVPVDGRTMTACVLYHPAIAEQLKVMPVYVKEVLDIVREQPRKPSQILQEYSAATGFAADDLAPVGDLLVSLHEAGLLRIGAAAQPAPERQLQPAE